MSTQFLRESAYKEHPSFAWCFHTPMDSMKKSITRDHAESSDGKFFRNCKVYIWTNKSHFDSLGHFLVMKYKNWNYEIIIYFFVFFKWT